MAASRLLLANGALVLAAGVLCGVPFYLSIVLDRPQERIRGWRVAHATLIADGLLLLVAGIVVPGLALGDLGRSVLAGSLVVSGWAFVFALGGGAWAGRRGLVPWPLGANTALFLGHVVGAAGSAIGVALLAAALLR